ncbi:hypothetical protein WH47_06579 [Habropoda laboriosa]|uniref:Uncharacterized protein n=1 Tax=Habropoda laboriosa TaxID=597456 RepID=A0A0L7RCR9_9HYME|nr:hypothetical protein WH47_06579 [Habropoda laboriosa]
MINKLFVLLATTSVDDSFLISISSTVPSPAPTTTRCCLLSLSESNKFLTPPAYTSPFFVFLE